MGKAGVDRFHIAYVLNHRGVTHSTVTAVYDQYRYDKEKRAALEKWAEVLSAIVEVKPRADDGTGDMSSGPKRVRSSRRRRDGAVRAPSECFFRSQVHRPLTCRAWSWRSDGRACAASRPRDLLVQGQYALT